MFTKTAIDIENSLYHATNEESLKRILDAGHIKTLKHVAQEDPTRQLSVELSPVPIRVEMPASKAVDALSKVKTVDKVFFTRGGILPNYGNYIIAKSLGSTKESPLFNSIPNEVVTPRKVSVLRKAKIFIPDDEIDKWRSMYPHMKHRLKPKSEFQAKTYGITDRAKALLSKIGAAVDLTQATEKDLNKLLGTRSAYFHGSVPLGTALDDADIDITVPYKSKKSFVRTANKFKEMFPELHEKDYGRVIPDKIVYKGKINNKDIDLSVTYGDRALAYKNAFNAARKKMTPEKRKEVLETKRRLKNSWFFPETRYKRYKNQLANELGLKQHYF